MHRISMLSLWSEKPASQRRAKCMTPSQRRQSTPSTTEAVAISVRQLEQRRIAASQEIVVTTTTLTLWIFIARDKIFAGANAP
jgi:hypothetical protein